MDAPYTYYQWAKVIDVLAEGGKDDEVLMAMNNGHIEWQKGVATRFIHMLMDVIDERMNKAVDKFQAVLQVNDPNALLSGIANVRRELGFLCRVASINPIPPDTRAQCVDHIVNFSKQIQSSLESSAESDTTGKLLSTLKNNPVIIDPNQGGNVQ